MSQLEVDSRFVKRGYWVNFNDGPIMGQTITVDSKYGSVVVALLAVLTTLGMTHLWHLLTFIYHQIRANGRPSDGLFRHQQALLRTLPTPSTLMADSVKLWFAWRGASNHALSRSLMHVSTALFFAMGSLTVSIFSSSVVSTSNLEVLVRSPHCGSLDRSHHSWTSYVAVVKSAAELYAPDCYRVGSLPSRCNAFLRPNIPFTSEIVPCPFEKKMCASEALSLDSGLLDLNDAFGLNLEQPDRVQYRRKSTCAVLSLDGYTEVKNASSSAAKALTRQLYPGEEFVYYMYGVFQVPGAPFTQSLLAANTSREMKSLSTTVYQADGDEEHTYILIPELQRNDADVSLRLTAKNGIKYFKPVNDPMFSAHRLVIQSTQTGNVSFYMSDFPGSMMGCVQQYQYCLDGNQCTELSGLLHPDTDRIIKTFPGASELQVSILELLAKSAMFSDLSQSERYEVQLLATDGHVETLPDDQWMKEIKGWEATAWAGHQIAIADHAIGPAVRDPFAKSSVLPPSKAAQKSLCEMQKMRKSGGFVNINFFGLLFTIIVSVTIVMIDLVLLRSLVHLRRYTSGLAPRIDRWLQDGIFQLTRRAYEAQGNGIWKNLAEEVPITTDKSALPDLTMETLIILPSPEILLPSPATPMSQTPTAQGQTGSQVAVSQPTQPPKRTSTEIPSFPVDTNGLSSSDHHSSILEAVPHQPNGRSSDEIQRVDI